jgi:hypothetical protein
VQPGLSSSRTLHLLSSHTRTPTRRMAPPKNLNLNPEFKTKEGSCSRPLLSIPKKGTRERNHKKS